MSKRERETLIFQRSPETPDGLPRLQADSPFNGPVPTERELLSSDLADDPTLQECREALEEPGLSVGCRPG